MIGGVPKFYNSPYFVGDPGNWHLKPGAPEDIKKEFAEFMELLNKQNGRKGVKQG